MENKNAVQQCVEQIGYEPVAKSLGLGLRLCNCDMHGLYAVPMSAKDCTCPLCAKVTDANGTTNTGGIEHYIDA